MQLGLLITPLARGAYFDDYRAVAEAELRAHLPDAAISFKEKGGLEFLCTELGEIHLPLLRRLSFVQGIFEERDQELHILDSNAGFAHPPSLVDGFKYKGKTNELVTQLGINIALAHCRAKGPHTLLDPMAGRGTTLLWALRYGISARGIEQDKKALEDLQRHIKRQTKLHRLKHKLSTGFVGKKNKQDLGKFLQLELGESKLQLVTGDSANSRKLLQGQRFSLIVSDLPYGVQHTGKGGTRNPIKNIEACAPGWAESLKPGGAMVLIFNAFQPKRDELAALFRDQGLEEQPFEAPHRMSESILRDLAVWVRPLD